MKNKEKGITIISLIVTIIILLILSAVTIRTITGDNGLIAKSRISIEESKKAEYKEGLDTVGLGVKIKTVGEEINTVEYMDKYLEELNQEKNKEGSLLKDSNIKRKNDETIRVETKEGYIYYVREDETIYVGKVGEVDEGNIAELRKADIIFSYSHNTWTNQDVEITISLPETVQNKENYRLECSRDNKNWSKYTEGSIITMTQNGKIYARTKDITGDIKVEGGYAEGEVTIIDKVLPTPGDITMKMASLGTPYEEDTEVYQNVAIEIIDGQDEDGGSGHKVTSCTITGGRGNQTNQTGRIILKASDEKYNITVTTEDNAGNKTTLSKTYIANPTYSKETKSMEAENGTYYLPEGFKLAENTAWKINEGIVIEDKQENEWVWVPCYVPGGVGNVAGAIQYDRYAFKLNDSKTTQTKLSEKDSDGSYKIIRADLSQNYFHEGLPTTGKEYNSIKKYGGYYIGRYEAGKENNSNTVLVQANKTPYASIAINQVKTLSEEMTSNDGSDKNKLDGTKVYTRLCSSYAWDTALMFIQKEHSDYAKTCKTKDNILAGQYNSNKYGTGIQKTGKTTPVCNIYDMGGNLYEYTTGNFNFNGYETVLRGGGSDTTVDGNAPGTRYGNSGVAWYMNGFRPTLYIN